MSQTLASDNKFFIISYDDGRGNIQSMNVPHELFQSEEEFRKHIIVMKCSDCHFESSFDIVAKESDKN